MQTRIQLLTDTRVSRRKANYSVIKLLSKVCDIVMEGMLTAKEKKNLEMDDNQPQHEFYSGDCDKVDNNERDDELSEGVLGDLPEVCLARILSCLPPRDVAKMACVCRSFRSASTFDSVWEHILPPKYKEFLALDPDAVPARFASKREIFDYLCHPMILENNTQAFWIDRDTGGVCLSIAARGLHITWSDDYRYWDWVPDQNSLFPEVARLKNVCWFEARGEIECSLPPGAYTFTWRMLLADLHGWHAEPAHFTLSKNEFENFECKSYIDPRPDVSRQPVEQFRLPTIRGIETGWTEYDVGEFFVEKGEETCTLKFSINAIHRGAWKSGLFLDGVVIRPTETVRRIQQVTSSRAESGSHTPEFQPEGPEFEFPEVLRRFFTGLPSFSRNWIR